LAADTPGLALKQAKLVFNPLLLEGGDYASLNILIDTVTSTSAALLWFGLVKLRPPRRLFQPQENAKFRRKKNSSKKNHRSVHFLNL